MDTIYVLLYIFNVNINFAQWDMHTHSHVSLHAIANKSKEALKRTSIYIYVYTYSTIYILYTHNTRIHIHTHAIHAITLSAFSFAAVNYQLSIVSTHFVQRQQTSTYGMIFYTFVQLSCRSPRWYRFLLCCFVKQHMFLLRLHGFRMAIPHLANNRYCVYKTLYNTYNCQLLNNR